MKRKYGWYVIVLGALLLQGLVQQVNAAGVGVIEDSCQITWTQKTHQYTEGGLREYHFKGHFVQPYSNSHGNYLRKIDFSIDGYYAAGTATNPNIGMGIGRGQWLENVHICTPIVSSYADPNHIYNCSSVGIHDLSQRERYFKKGDASEDPWISEGPVSTVDVNGDPAPDPLIFGHLFSTCFLNPPGAVNNSYHPPCPPMWSSCAYSAQERTNLRTALGTCTNDIAVRPPTIRLTFDDGSGHFNSPQDASVLLTVECLPSSIDINSQKNRFQLQVQKKEWDNEIYGFFWYDINKEYLPDMDLWVEQQNGTGGVNLRLSVAGHYRVRAKSIIRTNTTDVVASEYGDWLEFTAGDPDKEMSTLPRINGQQTAQKNPASNMAGWTAKKVLPDLAIIDFRADQEGGAEEKSLIPKWLVRNIGNKSAPGFQMRICCSLPEGQCPLSNFPDRMVSSKGPPNSCVTLHIDEELYPKPEGAPGTPGGGRWFGLDGPVPYPPAGKRYQLTATIDPHETIAEITKTNNQRVSSAPKMALIQTEPQAKQPITAAIGEQADQPSPAPPVAGDKTGITPGALSTQKIKKAGSFVTPAIHISGKKLYNPSENVLFSVTGDPQGKPVLESSPDGRLWRTHLPMVAVRKTGTGLQARYTIQAPVDAKRKYRLTIGTLSSEPFEIKAAVQNMAAPKPGSNAQTSGVKVKTADSLPTEGIKKPLSD